MAKSEDIKVTVTTEHINSAVRGSDTRCPIAISFRRQSDLKINVKSLTNGMSWFILKGKKKLYKLPSVAVHFAMDWDEGLKVTPFEFIAEAV